MKHETKHIAVICFICLVVIAAFVIGVLMANNLAGEHGSDNQRQSLGEIMSSITIRVNDREYKVRIADNEAAQEFASSTPFELPMIELNGNEKCYQGSDKLKAEAYNPGRIEAGDLMLYGDDCIVLFYKSFDTTYGYTRLGWVEDAEDLEEVLGSDNVTVIFTKN